MGWLDYMFDSELRQRGDIERLEYERRRAARAQRRARRGTRKQIETLEGEVEELELVLEAVVKLMIENGNFDSERLRQVMDEVRTLRTAEAESSGDDEEPARPIQAPRPSRKRR